MPQVYAACVCLIAVFGETLTRIAPDCVTFVIVSDVQFGHFVVYEWR